jgi:hypothetical protein
MSAVPDAADKERIMSSLHLSDTTKSKGDLKHHDYGFVLVLICMALALVVASAIFAPVPIGTGINDQTWFVGP